MFDLKYALKKGKSKDETIVIPGVGFEPTRTIRPLELKSNALTTRPSWYWYKYSSSLFDSVHLQAGCSYEELSIKMAGVISQPHGEHMRMKLLIYSLMEFAKINLMSD